MVRIGTAWDRTTEVLAGRGRMLVGIAALTFVLPSAIRAALQFFVAPTAGIGVRTFIGFVGLLTALVTIYGQLTLVAAVSDPAYRSGDAYRIARARFWPAIGAYAIVLACFILALIPIGIAIGASGVNLAGLDATNAAAAMPTGVIAFVALYGLAYLIATIYVSARLFVLNPVLVNERQGTGTFARAFALTRGAVWRIIGTMLVLVVVLLVAITATQAVVGLAFRLILGADGLGIALFLAAVAGAIVSAVYTVVLATLTTQFYLIARDRADPQDVAPAR